VQMAAINTSLSITAVSRDTGPGSQGTQSAATSWTLITPDDPQDFDDTNADTQMPALIDTWAQQVIGATEDVAINLGQLIDAKINITDTTDTFSITITGLPSGSSVTGMTQTTVESTTVWYAAAQGDSTILQALLSAITVTPPENWNDNNQPGGFQFDVTLTTFSPNGEQNIQPLTIDQAIDPASDPTTISISVVDGLEGEDIPIAIDLSNPADTSAFTIIEDDTLYVSINDNAMDSSGSLLDASENPLTITAVSGVTGIPDGNYYLVTPVALGSTVNLIYRPDSTASGSVSVSSYVRTAETGAADTIVSASSEVFNIAPVNSGYILDANDSTGDEDTLIPLDISGGGLIDSDGSEAVVAALLRHLPNGFLVRAGVDASSAVLANNAGDDGTGQGNNTWSIPTVGGNLPAFIGVLPPPNWSGVVGGLELVVLSGEAGLEPSETIALFDLTVIGVADGITLNPTLSTGVEAEKIPMNLNANMIDIDGSESVTLTVQGLGEFAAFFTNAGIDLLPWTYDSGTDTYTLTGITPTEINDLYFIQGAINTTLTITAKTIEADANADESALETKTMAINVSAITPSDGDDTLLFSGAALNGGAGEDTVLLRFGENIDFSDFPGAPPFSNIEIFDLDWLDSSNHSLSNISLQDVIDMTDGNNVLTINGDAGDSVSLLDVAPDPLDPLDVGQLWTLDSTASGYNVYVNNGNPAVSVFIAEEIGVTIE